MMNVGSFTEVGLSLKMYLTYSVLSKSKYTLRLTSCPTNKLPNIYALAQYLPY